MPSGSESTAISVDNLSITYRTSIEKKPTLRGTILRMGRGERSVREIEALKAVSFTVPRGSVTGVIGNNGAGKSTLMRAVAGILPPTAGRIEVHGKVSTLLSLGVGFNPDLSGYENVKLGLLAAGYTRQEIDERYSVIAEWTELGDFLEMPMRTYSSGMQARLKFAIAASKQHDILIIDEALSVGDKRFRERSEARIREMRDAAGTIFLVSHSMGSIRSTCNRTIWLSKGELVMDGETEDVVSAYEQSHSR